MSVAVVTAPTPRRITWRARAPSARLVLLTVGAVALAMRLALLLRAPAFIIADSEDYFLPGYQLARGLGFDLALRRTPGYPLFVALVVDRFGEDLGALLLAQHLLGVGTCLITAWLGLRLFGPWTALLAGLLTACAAPLLVAEHYVMAESLFVPAFVLVIAALVRALEAPGRAPLFVGGVLIGLAALVRPVGLLLAVTLAVALLVCERSLRRAVLRGLPAAAGLALVLLPWMGRNWLVHGSFSPDGNAGQTLVGRAMRHDAGFAFLDPDDSDPGRRRAREIMRDGRGGLVTPVRRRIGTELGLTEAETNRLMRDLAAEAILRQPDHYVRGTLANFARLGQGLPERPRDHWATRREARSREEWEDHPEIRHLLGPPTQIQQQHYGEVEVLLNLYQPARLGPILPLLALVGLLALILGSHRAAGALLGLTTLGMLLVAVALVAPLPRYRYPVEPLLTLLAAGGLASLLTWRRRAIGPITHKPGQHATLAPRADRPQP